MLVLHNSGTIEFRKSAPQPDFQPIITRAKLCPHCGMPLERVVITPRKECKRSSDVRLVRVNCGCDE